MNSATVKKIFSILIVTVMMLVLGAFLLNKLVPNVVSQAVNAIEDSVYKATGLSFDFNGDGDSGEGGNNSYEGGSDADDELSPDVEGFN